MTFHSATEDGNDAGFLCYSCAYQAMKSWNEPAEGLLKFVGECCPIDPQHTRCPGVLDTWLEWTRQVRLNPQRIKANPDEVTVELNKFANTLTSTTGMPDTQVARCPQCSYFRACTWKWEFRPVGSRPAVAAPERRFGMGVAFGVVVGAGVGAGAAAGAPVAAGAGAPGGAPVTAAAGAGAVDTSDGDDDVDDSDVDVAVAQPAARPTDLEPIIKKLLKTVFHVTCHSSSRCHCSTSLVYRQM